MNESERLLGPYRLVGVLRHEGMAILYEALHVPSQRGVALKVLPLEGDDDPRLRQGFFHEAQSLAAMVHPHIVQVYDIGEEENSLYLALQLLRGGTLQEQLSVLPAQPDRSVRLMARIARAIEYVHQLGWVHRDLKPGNVWLDAAGHPFLAGFSLSRPRNLGFAPSSGQVVGAPSFLPPEQARAGNDIGVAADVWGLGAVLYACLTGRPPFQARTVFDTLRRVIETEPDPPALINPAIDSELESICLSCLQKQPESRPHSADLLANQLETWLEQHSPDRTGTAGSPS